MNEFNAECVKMAIGPGFVPADTKPRYIPDALFATEHVALEMTVDPVKRTADCVSRTRIRFLQDNVRRVSFDALKMTVSSVDVDGRRKFRHDGKTLTVDLPGRHDAGAVLTVAVRYRLNDPEAGLCFVGPHNLYPGAPVQAWTQGQADDTRCWIPCRDLPSERATSEITVTVPDDFIAVSNGALVSATHNRSRRRRTFHWKQEKPHPFYLMTLTIGRFAEVRDQWDGIPITYYCERGRERDIRRGFGKTPKAVEFFSKITGVRYPWAKYAQICVADFFGGMENTSATTQTDNALIDRKAAIDTEYDGLMAHELAHQWFGDFVTCRDWSNGWLNESFATYYELLFQEHDKGREEFLHRLWTCARAYFAESAEYRRPIVTKKWRAAFDLFDRHLYQKGACVLRFLHSQVGDAAWRRAIKTYLEKNGPGSVQSGDLVNAIRAATGRNLEQWFDEWVHRAGHPDLRTQFSWDEESKEARVWIVQKDEKNLYDFPATIRFHTRGGVHGAAVRVEKREHHFSFKLDARPVMALFDPDYVMPIKAVEEIKSPDLWRAQLTRDPSPVGRVLAAQAIGGWNTAEALRLLVAAFQRERFWGVQSEIALAIGRMRVAGAGEAIHRIAQRGVSNARTRRAVVEAIGEQKVAAASPLLVRLFRSDASYQVQAESLRALARIGAKETRACIRRAFGMNAWYDLLRCAAVDATAILSERWTSVRPYAARGRSLTVRIAAIGQMVRLGKGDPAVTKILMDLTSDPSRTIRSRSVRALAALGDPAAEKHLRKVSEETTNTMLKSIADRAARSLRLGLEGEMPKATRMKTEGCIPQK